jgi:hypothetical protein
LRGNPSSLLDPEDRHKYNGVLSGAPRDRSRHRLSTTPVPHSPWHDASHRGLGGLAMLRINPHEPPGPKVHISGEEVSQVISGSAMLVSHAVVTRVNRTKNRPWRSHTTPHSPPPHEFLKPFKSVELAGSSSQSYPHVSAVPHSSRANLSSTRGS